MVQREPRGNPGTGATYQTERLLFLADSPSSLTPLTPFTLLALFTLSTPGRLEHLFPDNQLPPQRGWWCTIAIEWVYPVSETVNCKLSTVNFSKPALCIMSVWGIPKVSCQVATESHMLR